MPWIRDLVIAVAAVTMIAGACARRADAPQTAPLAAPSEPVVAAPVAVAPVAPAARVARAQLPCGDLTIPSSSTVAPESRGLLAASLARAADGAPFVTLTSYGSFAIPSRTATSSSDHTEAQTSWAFASNAGALEPIGALARGTNAAVVPGRGAIVLQLATGAFVACTAGKSSALPASPHPAAAVLAAHVDGNVLTVVSAASRPHGAPCAHLAAGVTIVSALYVDRLELASATWTTLATRAVAPPPTTTCTANGAASAAVGSAHALVVLERCEVVDAGDSIALPGCHVTSERFAAGAWQSAALATTFAQSVQAIVADADGLRVGVPVETSGDAKFQIYRVDANAFVADGAPIDGAPVAIHGERVISIDARGTPGPSGFGFRFFLRQLDHGTWVAIAAQLEATARAWTFALDADASFAVVSNEDETHARAFKLDGRVWQPIGKLDAPPSP